MEMKLAEWAHDGNNGRYQIDYQNDMIIKFSVLTRRNQVPTLTIITTSLIFQNSFYHSNEPIGHRNKKKIV